MGTTARTLVSRKGTRQRAFFGRLVAEKTQLSQAAHANAAGLTRSARAVDRGADREGDRGDEGFAPEGEPAFRQQGRVRRRCFQEPRCPLRGVAPAEGAKR